MAEYSTNHKGIVIILTAFRTLSSSTAGRMRQVQCLWRNKLRIAVRMLFRSSARREVPVRALSASCNDKTKDKRQKTKDKRQKTKDNIQGGERTISIGRGR
jgi:hypothetical protein